VFITIFDPNVKTIIKSNPEWELVDIYADDGISGTNNVNIPGNTL